MLRTRGRTPESCVRFEKRRKTDAGLSAWFLSTEILIAIGLQMYHRAEGLSRGRNGSIPWTILPLSQYFLL